MQLNKTGPSISNQIVTTCIAKKKCFLGISILVVSIVTVITVFLFVKSGVELSEIKRKLNTEIANVDDLEVKISALQSLVNSTQGKLEFISRDTSSKTAKLRSRMNELNNHIAEQDDRIAKHDKRVAVTSCISSEGNKSSGEILKFDDVITEIGINQLSAFETSGKFTCEKHGLYQFSVFITTPGRNLRYKPVSNF